MGLKTDIYNALEKNIGKEHIKNSPEGKAKIDTLAEDLANAILDFLTDKDRCVLKVDKLNASGGPVNVALTPLMSTPAAVGAPVFTTVPPIPMITVEVDKDGQGTGNPVGGGLPQSNASEVRLRKENVKGESGKY